MAPVCSNCNGTDFVWANELKTGMTGGGALSIRARGDLPLGTRICRTCGHADLFLRDISILHQPHLWRPGEFIPIVAKSATKTPTHHSGTSPGTPASPPAAPLSAAASPAAPPPPPPPPPEPEPVPVVEPAPVAPAMSEPDPVPEPAPAMAAADPMPEETPAEKPKPARKRGGRSKA